VPLPTADQVASIRQTGLDNALRIRRGSDRVELAGQKQRRSIADYRRLELRIANPGRLRITDCDEPVDHGATHKSRIHLR
jgi:hypothetical protein